LKVSLSLCSQCIFVNRIFITFSDGVLTPPIKAVDHDSGTNGQIKYTLLQSIQVPAFAYFKINENTGQLSLVTPLDYETSSKHVLFIEAKDNGNPALTCKFFSLWKKSVFFFSMFCCLS